MLVIRMSQYKIANHPGACLELSFGLSKYKTEIEANLLNLVFLVLAIDHELFNEWVDAFEFNLWFALKDLPEIELLQNEGRFLIKENLLAFSGDHRVDAGLTLLHHLFKLLPIFI